MVPRDSFGLLPSYSIRLELRMINRYHHKADKKSVWKHLAGRMRDLEGKKIYIFFTLNIKLNERLIKTYTYSSAGLVDEAIILYTFFLAA